MKTSLLKSFIFLVTVVSAFTLNSCSEEVNPNVEKKQLRIGPPPTPRSLEGLFDIQLSNGVMANLLFEFPNTVIYGSPTVTDMIAQTGRRTTYSSVGGFYVFTIIEGTTTMNFKFTYDATTAELLNGQYGMGLSYTDGTFYGLKHTPSGTGETLFKGYWVGKYGNGAAVPTNDYTMALEEVGKFTVAANPTIYGGSIASGLYSLSGNIFKGTYTYLSGGQYSCKGTYDPNTRRISGTWGVGLSYTNGGTFYLDMRNHL